MAEMLLNTAPRLVNSRTVYGTTPLMQAIEHSHLMVANLLIIRGADVDAQDKFGRTALMRGAAAGNSITARFLVAFHADVNIVDKDGRRAVDLALLSGNARVASDLQGSALAIVPGYISPQMQTTCQASMLLLSVLSHFADVVTDALLMVALWRHGSRALAVCSGVFVLLPSLLVAAIPYQSLVERLLTILQLRLVYEALLSLNQDRLTVRYGAVQMLHTVLENIPQMMIQGYLLATASRNSDADGDAENVDRTLVIIAFLT
ncbi:ACBP1, partial [Symbiodinium microadriaticum]